MAHNTSFTYDVNAENIVDNLLADESLTEGTNLSRELTVEVQEDLPISHVICYHQPQELFCTRCLSENCEFCTFSFHLGHPTVPLDEAFSKANYIKECLVMEANNVVVEIDSASLTLQDKIETLLRGSFDACMEIADNSKSLPLSKFEEEVLYAKIINTTRTKESLLRDQQNDLLKIREIASQAAIFLRTEFVLSIANQLTYNDRALGDLNHCRSMLTKSMKVSKMIFDEEAFVTNANTPAEMLDNGLVANLPGYSTQKDFGHLETSKDNRHFNSNGFLIGLPVTPLNQILCSNGKTHGRASTSESSSTDSSDSGSTTSTSPTPEMNVYKPIKILRRGEKA